MSKKPNAPNKYFTTQVKRLQEEHGAANIVMQLENNHNFEFFNAEIEEVVLGALLLEKDAYFQVSGILQPDFFYKETYRAVYEAIQQMNNNSLPIDVLTVTAYLIQNNFSFGKTPDFGPYNITVLTSRVGSAAHLEYHSRLLAELYMKRELYKLFKAATGMLAEADVKDILDFVLNTIEKVENCTSTKQAKNIYEIAKNVVDNYLREAEKKIADNNYVPGITNGFKTIDSLIGYLEAGELIILGARPSMGKTAVALSMAVNIAKCGIPVAFFSLEMSEDQITTRICSMELQIPYSELKDLKIGDPVKQQYFEMCDWANIPIYIDDSAMLTNYDLEYKLRVLKLKKGIQIVIIDYLQLMTATEYNGNKVNEVTFISSNLKKTAKKLGLPIIALSQLSRKADERADRRPILADLRESGAIEQDADKVYLLYRPNYYMDAEYKNLDGQEAEIIGAKNRNGPCNTAMLNFTPQYSLFYEGGNDEMF